MLQLVTRMVKKHRVLVAVGAGLGAVALVAVPVAVTGAPLAAPTHPLIPLPELNLGRLTQAPMWLGLPPVPPWHGLAEHIAALDPDLSPERIAPSMELIWKEAQRYGRDPYLDAVLVLVESDFDPRSTSPMGALGLYQLMPETAADMAVALQAGPVTPERLYDPGFNVRLGAYYLDQLHRKYGDWSRVLTAYNFGEGGMRSHVRETGTAESEYSRRVLALWGDLRASSGGMGRSALH